MVSPETSVKVLGKRFDRRFKYARFFKRHPSLTWILDRVAFRGDEIYYAPSDASVAKSRRIEVDIGVPQREDAVLPSDIAKELIERSRYHFIMDFCFCRNANQCESYPTELGCIFLGKGVLNIRGNVGRLATKDEALAHLEKCRQAGLVQLAGRNKIDSMWLRSGDPDQLMSLCNCCPCCCLWKMLPDLPENISSRITRLPGVDVRVLTDRCIGCGLCSESCFVGALRIADGRCRIDDSACRGCGRCADACPHDAILVSVSEVSVRDAADRLCQLVDIESERPRWRNPLERLYKMVDPTGFEPVTSAV